jgi:plastocyanin
MERRTLLAGSAVMFGGVGLVVHSGPPSDTHAVEVRDYTFDPVRLSVSVGDTVEWKNHDSTDNTVTAAAYHETASDWDIDARLTPRGGSVEHTFERTGIYEYGCAPLTANPKAAASL